MDYQDYKLCDRCKYQQVLLNCVSCSPFNNFCSKCDTDVHSLPSKMKHKRTPIEQLCQPHHQQKQIKPQTQMPHQSNDDSSFNTPQYNQQPSMNPDNPLFYYPSANLTFLETRQSDQRTTFTRDYVNELKSIHQKEKDELIFKNNSLQSALDRLKASFGEHINKMQVSVDENNKMNTSRIKQYEEENDYKQKKMLIDKENMIAQLVKVNEELKRSNDKVSQSLQQHDNEVNQIRDSYTNQISSLSNELNNKQNEIETIKQETVISCQAIEKEANEKIKDMSTSYESKLNELSINYNDQINSLKTDLDNTSRELFILKEKMDETKTEYKHHISLLQNDNAKLRNEILYVQDENSSLFQRMKQNESNANLAQTQNEIAIKTIERQKSDLMRKEEGIIFFENAIKALKNENCLLTDKNSRLQNDYTRMCSKADTMNYEYETKLKSLNYVEDKNFVLERENCELRNRMERIIRPYTFNK